MSASAACRAVLATALIAAAFCSTAEAQSVANFYTGRTITLVIGSGVGKEGMFSVSRVRGEGVSGPSP